ncbi:MAG: MBL fold metallo-hydrolase [Proteobacteria bacterium]|nr:MBL fold metallo-hydrolase [Pseudomonadota bacterium]
MLQFSALSSGSKANSIFVTDGETKLLIDCGLSARETEKRLRSIDVEAESIDAILITHEHSDHTSGVPVFIKKKKTALYANKDTYYGSQTLRKANHDKWQEFHTGIDFKIGNLKIKPFSIMHDAKDPVAFRIENGSASMAVVTDLGVVTNLVKENLQNLDAIVLESNHDPVLLRECDYSWELKQRIAARSGHLSNENAGELLEYLMSTSGKQLKVAIAAHISENSNHPSLALESFHSAFLKTSGWELPEFIAADVYQHTRLYTI